MLPQNAYQCMTLHERNGKLWPSRIITETIPPSDRILRADDDNLYFDIILIIQCVNWTALYSYMHVMTIYILTECLPVRFTWAVPSLDHSLCARDGNLLSFRMLTSVVRPLYYTLCACDIGRQADFVPEDCLFLGLEGNVEGHFICT
jgi:hypothetical protein